MTSMRNIQIKYAFAPWLHKDPPCCVFEPNSEEVVVCGDSQTLKLIALEEWVDHP